MFPRNMLSLFSLKISQVLSTFKTEVYFLNILNLCVCVGGGCIFTVYFILFF